MCALCALALLWVAGSAPGSCFAERARWKRVHSGAPGGTTGTRSV